MELRELNQMFDRLAPTQEQEEEGLRRLLEQERKVYPMKKLKKLTVIGIAAALMIITCAAAVVTGIDQRLLDFMGWSSQAQELLAPGAMPVDITAEDNGATLHITQVLRDRYSIMMMADFTVPEGTVLEMDTTDPFVSFRGAPPELLDGDGAPIVMEHSVSWNTVVLEDENPQDNQLSLVLTVELMDGIGEEVQTLALSNVDLAQFDDKKMKMVPFYTGDWSCEVPLPQNDTGWSQQTNTVMELSDATVYDKGIYLSPMTLELALGVDEGLSNVEKNRIQRLYLTPYEATLTDRNGQDIVLIAGSGSGTLNETVTLFQMPEIIDPAQFQGGTLSFEMGGQTFTIPLDDLTPVAE